MAKYPTSLSLKHLPIEGESLNYTEQTAELTPGLKDLINNHPYNIKLFIRPLGNAFEITGEIKASMDTACARCGRDMTLPIEDKFTELIVVEEERTRGGHTGHTGLDYSSDGIYCNHLSSYHIDITEFIHEHIAASEPFAPACNKTDCEEIVKRAQQDIKMPKMEDQDAKKSPFAALKELQVKSNSLTKN